jgi:hypothetical protein
LQVKVPWILSNPIFVGVVHEPLSPHMSIAVRAQLPKSANSYKR